MLAASASLLNIPVVILDVGTEARAKQIRELATKVDVLTVEIEHIDVDVLEEVEAQVEVHPAPSTIRTIRDTFRQKVHLQSHSLPIAFFLDIAEPTIPAIKDAVARLGLPLMLRSKTLAYDGRGNFALRDLSRTQTPSNFSAGAHYMRKSGCPSSRRLRSWSCVLPKGRFSLNKSWRRFIKTTSVTLYSHPFEAEIPKLRRALKI